MMTVKKILINEHNEGRRIDNFLISIFSTVPKSKIYNIIRKGEVRVNSSRKKPNYKLKLNDLIRICLLYTSPSPRDLAVSRMPSSA